MSGVRSMTGFSSVDGVVADSDKTQTGRGFSLWMKAVNHRHLDLSVRLPPGLDALDAELRKAVKAAVRRGHVELTLVLEKTASATRAEVDEELLEAYLTAFRGAAERFGLAQEPDLNGLLRMPGVISASVAAFNVSELERPVRAAMERLLDNFNAVRSGEGEVLAAELRAGMARIAELAEEARALRLRVAGEEFQKLSARLRELLSGAEVSEERLLTEAALLAARSDVEEELVRLSTHIARFVELLDGGGEVGRPLDFLLQELNREANTMLSKTGANAGDGGLRLTEIGLAVKVELERAREQVQNLE